MVKTVTKTIDHLDRMTNSVNGNPRFCVWFTDGTSGMTARDHAFCYVIENSEFQGVPVEVVYNGRGTIADITLVRA